MRAIGVDELATAIAGKLATAAAANQRAASPPIEMCSVQIPDVARSVKPTPQLTTVELLNSLAGMIDSLARRIDQFEQSLTQSAPNAAGETSCPKRVGLSGLVEDTMNQVNHAHETLSRISTYCGIEV